MPLARLQLRLPAQEGEKQDLNQAGKRLKTPWHLSFPWQSSLAKYYYRSDDSEY